MIALLPLSLLSGCIQPAQPPVVHVSPGHRIFLESCIDCHAGPGTPPGPNAVILNSTAMGSEADFTKFLRKPFSPSMPPFDEASMTPEQIHTLYEYLKWSAEGGDKKQ